MLQTKFYKPIGKHKNRELSHLRDRVELALLTPADEVYDLTLERAV
jgi:hypothetical protein